MEYGSFLLFFLILTVTYIIKSEPYIGCYIVTLHIFLRLTAIINITVVTNKFIIIITFAACIVAVSLLHSTTHVRLLLHTHTYTCYYNHLVPSSYERVVGRIKSSFQTVTN